MIFNVHGGHNPSGQIACGAVGILDESREDRIVKDKVIAKLQALGHTVYDCTCDNGTSQADVLNKIVAKCNSHKVDLDISIHFNAGGGHGVEVLVYPNGGAETYARNICNAVSALGFTNRGVKNRSDLYVLSKTNAKALLIECCFVDNQTDANLYNAEAMADAIVKGVCGQVAPPTPNPTPQPQPTAKANVYYSAKANGKIYPEVVNLSDYAGVFGRSITDLAIRADRGSISYKVHVKGRNWLPSVSGCNWNDSNNGYAGNGRVIDGLQITSNGCGGRIKYRVHIKNGNWLPYVYEATDYAGIYGKEIDAFQVVIE